MELDITAVKPLHDRVFIQPEEAESVSKGGIIIPDSAKEQQARGTVVAVGKGKAGESLTVKLGDYVLYGKYSGTETEIAGKKYLMMRETDIAAILIKDNEPSN